MKMILSFGLMALLVYLLMGVFIYLRQAGMIYLPHIPTRQLQARPSQIGLDYDEVRLTAEDGVSLHAWYIPAPDAKLTLLFCHGNAGNISHRLDSIALFHKLGLNVFIFDYRGYGQSQGQPSEQGSYQDVQAAWDYLTNEKQTPAGRIVLFGRSLGAAVASHLATRVEPAALILESAFASVPEMAAKLLPLFPARWLARYRYDNVQNVQSIHAPLLVIHSEQDEIIPYAQGRAVFEAAHEPKSFLLLHGGHNDGFMLSGEHYTDGLRLFLSRHVVAYREAQRGQPAR